MDPSISTLTDEDIQLIRNKELLEEIHIVVFNLLVKCKTNFISQSPSMWLDFTNIQPVPKDLKFI